jgi:hypothetical protein
MSPVEGFIVPMKAIMMMNTRCWRFGIATPVATIRNAQMRRSVRRS